MVDKIQALDDNDTWDLVPLPARKKVIRCNWVVAKKDPDGSISLLKACPIAKGYA